MTSHRAWVGPPDLWDVQGGMQFTLLYLLGLRGDHRLLDYGCGSLRAGRLFISYLEMGRYYGFEPNLKYTLMSMDREVIPTRGATLMSTTKEVDALPADHFLWVVAQSIFSHTGIKLAEEILDRVARLLDPKGLFLASVIDDHGGLAPEDDTWVYPSCCRIERDRWNELLLARGLHGLPLCWIHPTNQRWWVISKDPAHLRALGDVVSLKGPVGL